MPDVKVIYTCPDCDYQFQSEIGNAECPKCIAWAGRGQRSLVCEDCGKEVHLWDSMTNECECGALYNGFGQRLAPREEWAEEDGGY